MLSPEKLIESDNSQRQLVTVSYEYRSSGEDGRRTGLPGGANARGDVRRLDRLQGV
jgi:hypothetical protein